MMHRSILLSVFLFALGCTDPGATAWNQGDPEGLRGRADVGGTCRPNNGPDHDCGHGEGDEELAPLIIGTDGDYPPDIYCGDQETCPSTDQLIDPDDNSFGLDGTDVAVAREICGDLGRTCLFRIVPWAGIFERTDIDLIVTASSVRERVASFGMVTDYPYSSVAPIQFVTAGGCPSGTGPDEIGRVVAQTDTIYEGYLRDNGYDFFAVDTVEEIKAALADGSADATFIGTLALETSYVLENGLLVVDPDRNVIDDLHNASHFYVSWGRYIEEPELLRQINRSIDRLWKPSPGPNGTSIIAEIEGAYGRGTSTEDWDSIRERWSSTCGQ